MLASCLEHEPGLFPESKNSSMSYRGQHKNDIYQIVQTYVPDRNRKIMLYEISQNQFCFDGRRTPAHVETGLSTHRRCHCVHL